MHLYNGILLSHKKEWNLTIFNNIDEPREYHAKWNKSERERQIPYDINYMENLKIKINSQNRMEFGGLGEKGEGIERYKLTVTKQSEGIQSVMQ